MTDSGETLLQAGESTSAENGERCGRSRGGRLVLLRRRKADQGFVVTVDAPADQGGESTEMLTAEWGSANAAFDRMMKVF